MRRQKVVFLGYHRLWGFFSGLFSHLLVLMRPRIYYSDHTQFICALTWSLSLLLNLASSYIRCGLEGKNVMSIGSVYDIIEPP